MTSVHSETRAGAQAVVIVGCGPLGAHLAGVLDAEGCRVRLVDRDAAAFAALPARLAGSCFAGEPLELAVLQRAGIEEAEVLVAMTPEDDLNLAVALVCRKAFGTRHAIACVGDPERAEWYRRFDIAVICRTTLVTSALLAAVRAKAPS